MRNNRNFPENKMSEKFCEMSLLHHNANWFY